MFVIYCILKNDSPEITLDSLEEALQQYFSSTEGLTIVRESIFSDRTLKNLKLVWGKWAIRVFYEHGESVLDDSQEIAKRAGGDHAAAIMSSDRRIRVVFKSDPEKEYTNHILWMYEFLEDIPGLVLYDPQRNEWMN